MAFFDDFKKFIMKGNILELAVAVIIGAAFGKVVSSFVDNILMPPIGMLLGNVDFTDLMLVLKDAADPANIVAIRYGSFIQAIIDFLIIAFSVFVVLKTYDRIQRRKAAEPAPSVPPAPTNQELLLGEIRDLLRTGTTSRGV
ncbi:large-conductance mechanosensitive channel protein MscL [Cesiribacter andamanensis]|uniref:Large-conductance mechanosensitive channel n=1 Tax=Cesiribacter andamanensis AMV16 TaxID=1279009 RepID=M7N481_9BACT|nr:large-conductance mechanosensitive channel protein MscL [Cesiribacter andamanensis]EMR02097.1 Large-conductance mechanosensitive channel [Cesiribacter andamanensis AMV16]